MEYQTFRCPICNQVLPQYKDEEEDDTNNDVKYDKTTYRCRTDDVWVTIEVPIQSADPTVTTG